MSEVYRKLKVWTHTIRRRRACLSTVAISTLSIKIRPSSEDTNRSVRLLSIQTTRIANLLVASNARANVLLPDPAKIMSDHSCSKKREGIPVLPIIAVLEPPFMAKDRPDNEGSKCGAYLTVTLSKTISPVYSGHHAGGLTLPGGSCSM